MDANVTIRFKFLSVCDAQELKECDMTLLEMVEMLIEQEGIMGCVDEEYEIIGVEAIGGE